MRRSISSVQFSRSVVSDSLWPHESQHTRPLCPSPTRRVHSDSRPSSQWCHPAISSSVVPFSSCPQSLPASESFPMSQLFAWGGQSTGVSALASFLPKKSQGWSPSEWTGWISLQANGSHSSDFRLLFSQGVSSGLPFLSPEPIWSSFRRGQTSSVGVEDMGACWASQAREIKLILLKTSQSSHFHSHSALQLSVRLPILSLSGVHCFLTFILVGVGSSHHFP